MDSEDPYANYRPFGPFIPKDYVILPSSRGDIITAGTVFGLAMFFALTAAFIATQQTLASKRPFRSVYIWMVWLEWSSSVIIAIICLLYLTKRLRPSFYLFMGICMCCKPLGIVSR